MPPVFLTLGELLTIHRDQIERYGGASGVRDMGLLQSAASMPAATFGGQHLHADLYEMASAYLFHIVQNHPFVDGNKRVGAVAATWYNQHATTFRDASGRCTISLRIPWPSVPSRDADPSSTSADHRRQHRIDRR